jgi:hypothetical protein
MQWDHTELPATRFAPGTNLPIQSQYSSQPANGRRLSWPEHCKYNIACLRLLCDNKQVRLDRSGIEPASSTCIILISNYMNHLVSTLHKASISLKLPSSLVIVLCHPLTQNNQHYFETEWSCLFYPQYLEP